MMTGRIWRMRGLVKHFNKNIAIGRRLQYFSTAAGSPGATYTTHSGEPTVSLGLHAQLDPLFDENEGIFVLSLTRHVVPTTAAPHTPLTSLSHARTLKHTVRRVGLQCLVNADLQSMLQRQARGKERVGVPDVAGTARSCE